MNEQGVVPLRAKFAKFTAEALAAELRGDKTAYGGRIADALSKHTENTKRIPKPIKDLLDIVRPVTENPPSK